VHEITIINPNLAPVVIVSGVIVAPGAVVVDVVVVVGDASATAPRVLALRTAVTAAQRRNVRRRDRRVREYMDETVCRARARAYFPHPSTLLVPSPVVRGRGPVSPGSAALQSQKSFINFDDGGSTIDERRVSPLRVQRASRILDQRTD
jgi:hypothetical protein